MLGSVPTGTSRLSLAESTEGLEDLRVKPGHQQGTTLYLANYVLQDLFGLGALWGLDGLALKEKGQVYTANCGSIGGGQRTPA